MLLTSAVELARQTTNHVSFPNFSDIMSLYIYKTIQSRVSTEVLKTAIFSFRKPKTKPRVFFAKYQLKLNQLFQAELL